MSQIRPLQQPLNSKYKYTSPLVDSRHPNMSNNRANPPADPSSIPDDLLRLSVSLDMKDYLSSGDLRSIQLFRNADDEQRVESRIANEPVQVRIYQGETRASTPVTEQTRFDIVKR